MASTKAKFGFIKGSSIIDVAELPNPVVKSAINPTGTYDKIWFNTSLSFDAVDNILNNLDYGDIEQYYIYLGIDSSNMPIRYIVISRIEDYVNESGYAYSIRVANQSDNILIYNSQNYQGNVKGFRNFDNPLGITFSGGIEQLVIEGMTIIAGQQNDLLKDLIYVEEVNENAINTKALYRLPDGTLWHYYNGQWNAVGSGGGSGEVLKLNLTDLGNTPMSDDVVNKVIENKISKIELIIMGDETGGYAVTLEPSFIISEGSFSSCIFSNVNPYMFDEMKPWFFGIVLDPESKVFMEVFDTMLLSKTDITGIYSPVDMSSKSIKTVSTSDTFMGYTHNIVDFVNINANFSGNFSFADDIDKHKERTLYLKNLKSSLTYTISNDLGDATSGTTLYNNSKYNTSDIVKILNARIIKLTGITGNIILQYNYDSNIWTISDGFVGTISES